MPVYASSPVTSTPRPDSLDEPLQDQPKASTSTNSRLILHYPPIFDDRPNTPLILEVSWGAGQTPLAALAPKFLLLYGALS